VVNGSQSVPDSCCKTPKPGCAARDNANNANNIFMRVSVLLQQSVSIIVFNSWFKIVLCFQLQLFTITALIVLWKKSAIVHQLLLNWIILPLLPIDFFATVHFCCKAFRAKY
jgi:hypothetical protein